jgi:hypothetical protein
VPAGSSSISIRELWPSIDQLDEAGQASHSLVNFRGSKGTGEGTSRAARGASVDEASSSSSALPRDCGGGSVKSKVVRILSNAIRAISPHMRRSFVDRQYSPSTGMIGMSEK